MRRLGLLGRAMPGGMLGQPRYRWYAPAWNVDSNGRAYAQPTLGPELFANTGFGADTDWTKGTGWSIAGGVAVGSAVAANQALTQSVLLSDLKPFVLTCDIPSYTGGNLRMRQGSSSIGSGFNSAGAGKAGSAFPSQSGAAGVAGEASAFTGTVDNMSCKVLTQVAHAGVRANNVRQVGIRLTTYSNMHQVQLYGWSSEHPLVEAQNCVRISIIGTPSVPFRLRLAKQVNGVFTAVINYTDSAFVQDALLEIRRPSANIFQMWYNGSQVGSDVTINDASVINNALFSMVALHPTTLISEFQINGTKVPFRF